MENTKNLLKSSLRGREEGGGGKTFLALLNLTKKREKKIREKRRQLKLPAEKNELSSIQLKGSQFV